MAALQIVEDTRVDDTEFTDKEFYSALARIPAEDEFSDSEFIELPELGNIASRLIKRHDMPAGNFDVVVLWKNKGGRSAGREKWGGTQKLAGVTKYLSEQADFVIWIAADHCRNSRVTNYQLEAIMFHELLHIEKSEDEEGNVNGFVKSHDFEGFYRDIEVYGNWLPQYKGVADSMKQAPLVMDGYVTVGVYDE